MASFETRRFSRFEYEKLIELGVFQPGEPIELLGGHLVPLDRQYKGSLYARAGVADYWIVNLVHRVLEVYREPQADSAAAFGGRYTRDETLGSAAAVTPLAAPASSVPVSQLLP